MQISGASMVIQALHREGVTDVFGYPGGAIMNVYDEIYKQDYFKHYLNRHEQAAVHSADAYARTTGKVGVAIVTSGPGFTNAVTGLATAYMDSIPMVVISGQVPLPLIGTDAFQEIDAVGISRPCTKHNYLVKKLEDLPRIIKEAFYLANSGRKGPVHIDIPKDITAQIGEFNYDIPVDMHTYKPVTKGNKKQIKKAVQAIADANKPLLYLGGGIARSSADDLVRQLAKVCNIPAIETLMARGAMSDDNELWLGMVGMHGSYCANMAMYETDLIISLGARFDDRVTGKLSEFGKNAKIIHVDIDPTSIGKIVAIDYPIVGDLENVLPEMIELAKAIVNPTKYEEWIDHLHGYKVKHPLSFDKESEVIKPQWVISQVGSILGQKAVITTDVGQHQMWTAQFFPFSSTKQFATSAGLGTMGFGFPAAIGAKVGNKDKVVINFTGDGSILMNIQELMTAVEYKIPVINIVLNNNYLGMVRQWQTFFYEDRLAETDLSAQPDFIKVSEAFGGVGYRVTNKDEFADALNKAIESNTVAFIEVIVDRRENVLPMVPNGVALNNMILKHEDE
jgi:acetolactate synthase-1/2/3 large subunit